MLMGLSTTPLFVRLHTTRCRMQNLEDDSAAAAVDGWLSDVVLKHGLCPWAAPSLQNGGLRIITCYATDQASVFEDIVDERDRLFDADAPELSTTLLVCPSVDGWDDFEAFDSFVSTADEALRDGETGLSLVAFHPSFARWRQLPPELVASLERDEAVDVLAHYEDELGRRSETAERAVLLDVEEATAGVRKVAVRFGDGAEQLLPIEWVLGPPAASGAAAPPTLQPPTLQSLLADNWIHACPVPMVHLLRGEELAREALRAGADAIDALQCRNAQTARGRRVSGGAEGRMS